MDNNLVTKNVAPISWGTAYVFLVNKFIIDAFWQEIFIYFTPIATVILHNLGTYIKINIKSFFITRKNNTNKKMLNTKLVELYASQDLEPCTQKQERIKIIKNAIHNLEIKEVTSILENID